MSRNQAPSHPFCRSAATGVAQHTDRPAESSVSPAWPEVSPAEHFPPAPVPESRQSLPASATSGVSTLRTAQPLRALAELLRHISSLVRNLLSSTSPVSKGMRRLQGRDRRLQVAETVQLGEKRFVAILRVDGQQFLIGGSATGVSLLTTLAAAPATATEEPVRVVPATDGLQITDATSTFSAVLAAQGRHGGLA